MDPAEGFFSAEHIANLAQNGDLAYPTLILNVLPKPLLGFFAAVLFGAILSSFNSALNSSVTLYTLDIHRPLFNPQATDAQLVRIGKIFGTVLAIVSICVAPGSSALLPPVCMTSSSPASDSSTCRFWRRSSSVCSPETFPLVPPRYRS